MDIIPGKFCIFSNLGKAFLDPTHLSRLTTNCHCTSWTSFYLEFLQIGSLLRHDDGEKLILQTIPGDGEVDECGLGLHLRLVMRIGQLGVQDETELGVILHLFVSEYDIPVV